MIVDVASEKQAEDIVMIDISEVSSLANYFVILSGGTSGQIRALRDEMVKNGYNTASRYSTKAALEKDILIYKSLSNNF